MAMEYACVDSVHYYKVTPEGSEGAYGCPGLFSAARDMIDRGVAHRTYVMHLWVEPNRVIEAHNMAILCLPRIHSMTVDVLGFPITVSVPFLKSHGMGTVKDLLVMTTAELQEQFGMTGAMIDQIDEALSAWSVTRSIIADQTAIPVGPLSPSMYDKG